MPSLTIGSAGADFATFTLWEANLVGSGGLKSTAEGRIFNVGDLGSHTFNGIDTSAYRVVMKPAASAAFWQHVSASSNPVQHNKSFGAAVSGGTGFADALNFNDCPVTISGLMVGVSGSYGVAVAITDSQACAAVRDYNVRNSIVYSRATGGGATRGRTVQSSGAQILRLTNVVSWFNHEVGIDDRHAHVQADMGAPGRVVATNCTFVATSGVLSNSSTLPMGVQASAPVIRNCLFMQCHPTMADVSGSNVEGGHNVSNLATASTTILSSAAPFFGSVSIASALVSYEASAGVPYGLDASLKNGASTVIVDNACATWAPATDVLNRTRQAPHDIGAFDYDAIWPTGGGGGGARRPFYAYSPLGNLTFSPVGLRTT